MNASQSSIPTPPQTNSLRLGVCTALAWVLLLILIVVTNSDEVPLNSLQAINIGLVHAMLIQGVWLASVFRQRIWSWVTISLCLTLAIVWLPQQVRLAEPDRVRLIYVSLLALVIVQLPLFFVVGIPAWCRSIGELGANRRQFGVFDLAALTLASAILLGLAIRLPPRAATDVAWLSYVGFLCGIEIVTVIIARAALAASRWRWFALTLMAAMTATVVSLILSGVAFRTNALAMGLAELAVSVASKPLSLVLASFFAASVLISSCGRVDRNRVSNNS